VRGATAGETVGQHPRRAHRAARAGPARRARRELSETCWRPPCSLAGRRAALGGRGGRRAGAPLSGQLDVAWPALSPAALLLRPRTRLGGSRRALVASCLSVLLLAPARLPARMDTAGVASPPRSSGLSRPSRAGFLAGRGRVPAVQRLAVGGSCLPAGRGGRLHRLSAPAAHLCLAGPRPASGAARRDAAGRPARRRPLAARRAPLVAAWTAIVTYLVLALAAPARTGFAGFQAPGGLAGRLTVAGNPVAALVVGARAIATWPCLVQAALCAGLALALAVALRLGRLEARLWVWSLAFSAFYILGARAAGRGLAAARRFARAACERRRGRRRQRRRAGSRLTHSPLRRGALRRSHLGRSLGRPRKTPVAAPAGSACMAGSPEACRERSLRGRTCGSLLPCAGRARRERARSRR